MMDTLSPGFGDPVADSQACFRAVLDAMSRPGRVARVAGVVPPAPLGVATAAVALCLFDHETPIWLDPRADACADWIGFHTGAPRVELDRASFALALSLPDFASLTAGTHESPEQSATIVLQVASIGTGSAFRLSGPGLRTPTVLRVTGLPDDFVARWDANRALFPRGIDLVLCADDRLTALPRGIRIEEG